MRSIPNFFWIILVLALGLSFGTLAIFIVYKVITDMLHGQDVGGLILVVIFLFFLFGMFALNFLYQTYLFLLIVVVEETHIKIISPLRLKSTTFHLSETKGLSESQVKFGNYSWTSKSLILYMRNGQVFEIVSAYHLNFKRISEQIKKLPITRFGTESYQTDWFFRKYRYR